MTSSAHEHDSLRISVAALVAVLACFVTGGFLTELNADELNADEHSPKEVFNQRILPIFQSPDPSSCVQCHLAAVDLKDYILPSHKKTFLSLRDQGLINLEEPQRSKILSLIKMGEQDLDEGARLIHENTRKAEYAAFAAWIEACCDDVDLRQLPPLSAGERAGPRRALPVVRHARKSRVLDSFVRNVWSQRMRCFPCHTPYELDATNPRHKIPIQKQQEFREKYGDEVADRIAFFRESPAASLKHLVQRSRQASDGELPMINLQEPTQSLLILKPTSRPPKKNEQGEISIPTSKDPMTHMGGLKMHPNDQSYKSIVAWIQDYARVVGDDYLTPDQLPADNWRPSQLIVRLSDVPPSWPVGTPVQLFVHPLGEASGSDPVAFTQGTVTPRRFVNGALFLFAKGEQNEHADSESALLARGDYEVKVYVDLDGRILADPTVLLGDEEFAGQASLKNARWRPGFRFAERVSAKDF